MPPKRRGAAATRSTTKSASPASSASASASGRSSPSAASTSKSSIAPADTSDEEEASAPPTPKPEHAYSNSIDASASAGAVNKKTGQIHPIYLVFFLTLEPLASLLGFWAAYFAPAYYLRETRSVPSTSPFPATSASGSNADSAKSWTLSGLLGNNAGALDAAVDSDAPWSFGTGAGARSGAVAGMWAANADVPVNVLVVLGQLANLYVLFGVLEAFVLRAASSQRIPLPLPSVLSRGKRVGSPERAAIARSGAHGAKERVVQVLRGVLGLGEGTVYDLQVWRVFLAGLLLADLGHLASLWRLGWGVYWRVWGWNGMAVGNVGFVYVGAALRVGFLTRLGVKE
ncbi:MAG: hypothetical protein M1831_007015 [Alyxoria varia]|nr:MAG: hypothetical protein M1831_007015 [Alyxoria varia]